MVSTVCRSAIRIVNDFRVSFMTVRKSGFQGEIDGHGVLGLHVIEAREDQAKNLLGGRTQLGDVFGSAASAKPSDFRCWQGSFPFECVNAPARSRSDCKIDGLAKVSTG